MKFSLQKRNYIFMTVQFILDLPKRNKVIRDRYYLSYCFVIIRVLFYNNSRAII